MADSGPGVGDGRPGQVFERFHTGDAARGAGLGLAIAQELAERMDGRDRAQLAARQHGLHARAARGRLMRRSRCS